VAWTGRRHRPVWHDGHVAASLVSPVLVGRQAELESLAGGLERALAGEQVTMLVGGEAGVGKSRLVRELIDRARGAGARVLVGGCVELGGGGIPFAPLVEMMRALAVELSEQQLDAVLGPARAEIGRLVPELGDRSPSEPQPERDPATLLELMVGMVGRLATDAPLMLVFEDLQWADGPTLDLLALLVARSSPRSLLLVFTARSDELHRAHPFRRMAARWEQQRVVGRLELERLVPGEVGAQIEAILGERPDGELVRFIAERSEGIPLFVEELLGAVREGHVEHDFLPPSLRDVVLARTELLSENGRHVLRVVSAAARWVPDRLLATVAGLPESDLNAGLRESMAGQLLVVDESGRGYGFRHELARAAVHDDLLPGERAQLHRAYAEAIEGSVELAGDLDASSMLAHHWLAAHDMARALPASVRAGRAAAGASAPSAAQRHFELALELWNQVPDAEERAGIDHAELLEVAADAAWRAGAAERGLALVDEALTEVGDEDTLKRRLGLLTRRGELLSDLGRDEEGLTELERAVNLLPPDSPSRLNAQALGSFARALARVDRFQLAGELARRALDAAEAAGAVDVKLEAQLILAVSMVYAGDAEAGLALMREAAEESRRIGLLWIATRAFIGLSDQELMLGRYAEVIQTIDDGLPLARRAGLEHSIGAFMRGNRVEALMRSGRWQEAMANAVPAGEPPGIYAGALPLLRAELLVLSGRREEAEAELREARHHLRRSSAAQWLLPVATVEAELARSRGDLDAARDVVERALTRADISEEHRYKWPLLSLGARIEAERSLAAEDRGDTDDEDQRRRTLELREQAETMATTTAADLGHRALVEAELAPTLGADASAAWSEAVSACRAMNEPYPLAYALLRHAESLTAAGDLEGASAAAREALELAEWMGAAPLVDEIQALVRRARLRTDTNGNGAEPSDADAGSDELTRLGLTAREREVLGLVVEGYSNGQIAERLFISRKTASVHVSNILAKLGAATRVEAAAIAHRLGLVPVSSPSEVGKREI
jgi:DNA-binding CsgD family transcriptional regulator/tetratricopeptide (TPR) repeat protein